MSTPSTRREGNLRLATMESTSLPEDPQLLHAAVLERLSTQPAEPYGPLVIWFDHAPGPGSPYTWPCRIGSALTGMARHADGLMVDDYRDLTALSQAHLGPAADLGLAHTSLCTEAGRHGASVRPYWRLALAHQRLSDGNLLPQPTVSIFIDPPAKGG